MYDDWANTRLRLANDGLSFIDSRLFTFAHIRSTTNKCNCVRPGNPRTLHHLSYHFWHSICCDRTALGRRSLAQRQFSVACTNDAPTLILRSAPSIMLLLAERQCVTIHINAAQRMPNNFASPDTTAVFHNRASLIFHQFRLVRLHRKFVTNNACCSRAAQRSKVNYYLEIYTFSQSK